MKKKVDYIIVGLGLAGLAFAEELSEANKSFIVFEDDSQTSSLVAGGVYNPVILKRFTPVWNAKEQLEIALPFYERLERKFNAKFDEKFQIKKVFKSIEDQNNWFEASDKPLLSNYLNPIIDHQKIDGIIADFGFGNVKEAGRIDTKKLVERYREYLQKEHKIIFEKFDYDLIEIEENQVNYKDTCANRIVFCEGFGIKQNPFFNYLPLNEAKGELLTIHAPDLQIDFLLKSTLFVMPLGDHLYKVGATFNWTDKTSNPSKEGKEELVEKLKKVITVPYTIVSQSAGIRPTVAGRRPLIGIHPVHGNLVVLNGLGTRGVMIAPTMAKQLFNHLEKGGTLETEVDIKRFG
ncbi:glycine/D-amino acid oxidase-like deaminating enzyme [Lutibacter sp. Hel_I_33_5]|uniref:NAD(P)/FAD-dependent oxidoreductase n=1 Tax=Lutibacter sp. Hel_I_33_5 TaxID=1566289 RepID=UPI0011A4A0A2|nr:FAD-binding oxidoreductase [Lutibacter sp. Hel_I_33_5]TVZ56770.1 glycine/D-amino acid oxidase-like deaminating enzyme [Lutibacter sp. Hel_I_33_5]